MACALALAAIASAGPNALTVKGKYVCSGAQRTVFDNWNGYPVDDGGAPTTFSTKGKAYCVTYIETYHWNGGDGAPPGTLGLKQISAPIITLPTEIGPYPAKGSAGQGGVENANWYVDVPSAPPEIIDGRYECEDSSATTWSANKESGGQGFCMIYAVPAIYAVAH